MAIAFGCDPVVTYAASAPLPSDIDEYLFAGFLRQERVEMVDCVTVPLQVPADAQVVLEGWLEPGERRPEGPFGDHTGFYTPVEPFPALTIDCMTMQKNPVFQSDRGRSTAAEDGPLGKATERIFLPLVKLLIPDIVDMDMPVEGVFHNCVIVSIDKRFPKHAHKVMHAIWGAGMLSLAKLIVVVDADCDVHDYSEVAWRAFGNVDYSPRPGAIRRPGRPPRSRELPAVLGRQGRHRRDRKVADRGLHPRLAGDDHAGSRGRRASDRPLEGVRHFMSATAAVDPGCADARPGQGVPRPGAVRAFGVRAAVRLHRCADGDG